MRPVCIGKGIAIHALAMILSSLLVVCAQSAEASDDPHLLSLLTCNMQKGTPYYTKASEDLEARARKTAEGGLYLEDRVQNGDACIEHATVAAAFGVLMTVAGVCDGKAEPLMQLLERSYSRLRSKSEPIHPGVIAAFEAPKFSLVLFRGEPIFSANPDPASHKVAYICTYHDSGPQ